MTGISNIRLEPGSYEKQEQQEEKYSQLALLNLDDTTKGLLAVSIIKQKTGKEPVGKLSPAQIDNVLLTSSADDIVNVVLEKQFGISKTRFDSILSTSGLSAEDKVLFYQSGGKSLSDVNRIKLKTRLAAAGFTPSEIDKILVGPLASPQAAYSAINTPVVSTNQTYGSQTIVLKPFPSKPTMTIESFSQIMFEAMSAIIISRSKSQLYDTDNAQKRLEDMVLTMENKIHLAKEQAQKVSEQGVASYQRVKDAKQMQALMAFFAALMAIVLAIVTVVVSIATFGAGTAPMMMATIGAIIGAVGAIAGSGLAISDALRTDGRSWADGVIGSPKTPKSAEEQESYRVKKEQAQLGMTIAEGVVDSIATVFSFGAYLAAAVIKNVIAQTIKAVLQSIVESMRTMMARTISTLASLILCAIAKVMAGLIQSGTMVRMLAGEEADNSSERSLANTMKREREQLKQSSFFKQMAIEKGTDAASSEIEKYISTESKLISSGNQEGLAAFKKESAEKMFGRTLSSFEISKFNNEATSQIKQAIVDEQTYYSSLSSKVFAENNGRLTAMMLGSALAALASSLTTSIINFRQGSLQEIGSLQSASTVHAAGKLLVEEGLETSIESLAKQRSTSSQLRQNAQTAVAMTATIQTTLGAVASMYQAIAQNTNLAEQKKVTSGMAQLNRMMTMLDTYIFMLRMLSDSSFEIQEATLESMKKTAEAFANLWKAADAVFTVGVQRQF